MDELLPYAPEGSIIVPNTVVNLRMNPITKEVTGTMTVKLGKEQSVVEINIPANEVPPAITNKVTTEANNVIYNAENPYALKYRNFYEIPRDRKEWDSIVETIPSEERSQAHANPPKLQTDFINEAIMVYGKDLVEKNKKAIQEIIDSPFKYNVEVANKQWDIVGRIGDDDPIIRQSSGQTNYNPDDIDKSMRSTTEEIASQQIDNLLKGQQQ